MKHYALVALVLVATAQSGSARDLGTLAREGYAVVERTRVDGEFEGCDFDRIIRFMNGMRFECRGFSYTYSYNPEVLILRHVDTRRIKVLIKDREYNGTVYRP